MNTIKADEGYQLTQKNVQSEDMRVFTPSATGVNATWEYWEQWTDAQVEQWHKDHPDPEPPIEELNNAEQI